MNAVFIRAQNVMSVSINIVSKKLTSLKLIVNTLALSVQMVISSP